MKLIAQPWSGLTLMLARFEIVGRRSTNGRILRLVQSLEAMDDEQFEEFRDSLLGDGGWSGYQGCR